MHCDVSESLLLDTSKILVETGLRDVGYKYVVLDDCWQDGRDDTGHVKVDQAKFPNGMKSVATHLHDDGLLFGMYSSAGERTCAGYGKFHRFHEFAVITSLTQVLIVGSLDYEKEDAESFASWDVDYLKYDNCYHMGRMGTPLISFNRYKAMADALNATGRPIFYGLCNWGEDYSHTVCPFSHVSKAVICPPANFSVGRVYRQLVAYLWRYLRLLQSPRPSV